ncbi:MAG: nucleotidyl transferase AbiEii/AbiGii toxin family protein [Candidatus Dormibacteria bacterium]
MSETPPLRRFGSRIHKIVREVGVPYESVLKDHALSYLLAGIASVPDLRTHLVFKGGTALRKCFFPTHRYSIDLDFSTRDLHRWSPAAFLTLLVDACLRAEDLTAVFGSYSFAPRVVRHRADHPHDQLDLRVDVVFPNDAKASLKVEVIQDEPIVRPIADRGILHAFDGEGFDARIATYSLDEIVLEKLRAFLQVRAALRSRAWTNRARDLFDLYAIHHDHEELVEWAELLESLHIKANARGVAFSGPEDFCTPEVMAAYRDQWTGSLENLVGGTLPDFDTAEDELQRVLVAVFGTNVDAAPAKRATARGRANTTMQVDADRRAMEPAGARPVSSVSRSRVNH